MQATGLGITSGICVILLGSLLIGTPLSLARAEQIVQQVSGKGHQHLEPFTINDDWELRWTFTGEVGNDLFQVVLHTTNPDRPVDLVTQKGSGQGTKHQKHGGTYYLKVIGVMGGKWTVTVVQLR